MTQRLNHAPLFTLRFPQHLPLGGPLCFGCGACDYYGSFYELSDREQVASLNLSVLFHVQVKGTSADKVCNT